MERMLCDQCSAVTYSAAARMLIERGDRCPGCGGPLAVDDGELSDERVTVPADPPRTGGDDDATA
jgi:Zn-finger nucleic acid-binding protein